MWSSGSSVYLAVGRSGFDFLAKSDPKDFKSWHFTMSNDC